ncbi:MAG: ribosomal-protein-alanine N-acetyltransferase [Chloroflexi bacterium]|nr:ribosomal-protein-alanine N-acetyltransferase [Chloroflexota bacterium]
MALADVPAVADLEKLVFTLPWSANAFDYELRFNRMSHFLVVRQRADILTVRSETAVSLQKDQQPGNNTPQPVLGYGGFWFIVDQAHICTLAVHPNWRGRGLGELLLVNLLDLASKVGATTATLEVRASNFVAQCLYAKYGFVQAGLRKGYYSDNHEDALIMTTDPIVSAAYQSRFQAQKALLEQRLVAESGKGSPGRIGPQDKRFCGQELDLGPQHS